MTEPVISENLQKLISDLKVNELRAELEKRGFDKSGVKAILIERLEQALKNEGHDVTTFIFTNDNTTPNAITADASRSGQANEFADKTDNNHNIVNASSTNADVLENTNAAIVNVNSIMTNDKWPPAQQQNVSAEKDASDSAGTEKVTPMETDENAIVDKMVGSQKQANTLNDEAPMEANTNNKENTTTADSTTNLLVVNDGKNEQSNQPTNAMPTSTPAQKQQRTIEQDLAGSVWIRGISSSTKAADLKTLFSKYGKVMAAKIFTTKNKTSPACFGYITMAEAESANVCIQKLNRTNLKGKVIAVEKASRSLLPQISKAGKVGALTAPASSTVSNATEKSGTSNAESTAKNVTDGDDGGDESTKISENSAPILVNAKIETGGESPEIIFEDVKTRRADMTTTSSGENANALKCAADNKGSDAPKKTDRPRIISTTKSASRKIRPPAGSSSTAGNDGTSDSSKKVVKTSSSASTTANRLTKNIARRVLTTYRPNNTYNNSKSTTSSYARSRVATAQRFIRPSIGSSSAKSGIRPSYATTSSSSAMAASRIRAANRISYRGRPIASGSGASSRFQPRSSTTTGRMPPLLSGRHGDESPAKISTWERNELLMTMRRREDEYRKKEEELRLQRERERLKFERERLEREKLEIQQLKLTAQLANAQMALIPNAGGQQVADYGDSCVLGTSGGKSSSLKKHHTNDNSNSSHREGRHSSSTHRGHSSSNAPARSGKSRTNRTRSSTRSRSPYRIDVSNMKRGNANVNSRGGRYADNKSSRGRYNSGGSSTNYHHQHSNSNNQRSMASSSHHDKATRGTHSSRFGNAGPFAYNSGGGGSESRSFRPSSSVVNERNRSPSRRNTGRSSGGDRDNYGSNSSGVQRFFSDDLRVSQYVARTDPSYAARLSGGSDNVNGGSSNNMGISADEMFGLGGNFYSSSNSKIGNNSGGYRDSLPSTYQTTLNNSGGGGSGFPWGGGTSSSSGGRTSYVDNALALNTSSTWVSNFTGSSSSGALNVSSAGRSDWDSNNYALTSNNGQFTGGRYGGSGTSGGYSSRRY